MTRKGTVIFIALAIVALFTIAAHGEDQNSSNDFNSFDGTVVTVDSGKPAYGESQPDPDDFSTFDGTVSAVDTGKSALTVKGGVTMSFTISPDTKITKDIYDIRLSDIEPGDYVSVGYYKIDSGPAKVLTVTIKYGKANIY